MRPHTRRQPPSRDRHPLIPVTTSSSQCRWHGRAPLSARGVNAAPPPLHTTPTGCCACSSCLRATRPPVCGAIAMARLADGARNAQTESDGARRGACAPQHFIYLPHSARNYPHRACSQQVVSCVRGLMMRGGLEVFAPVCVRAPCARICTRAPVSVPERCEMMRIVFCPSFSIPPPTYYGISLSSLTTSRTQAYHYRTSRAAGEHLLPLDGSPPRFLHALCLAPGLLVRDAFSRSRSLYSCSLSRVTLSVPSSVPRHRLAMPPCCLLMAHERVHARIVHWHRYTESRTRTVRLLGQLSVMMFLFSVGSFLIVSFNIWDRTGRFPWEH